MPSICQPWADVDSPDGARLLAEAAAAFGTGLEPDPPSDRAAADPFPYFLLGLILTSGVFALASMAARRRESGA
jgi:hypothetical protein